MTKEQENLFTKWHIYLSVIDAFPNSNSKTQLALLTPDFLLLYCRAFLQKFTSGLLYFCEPLFLSAQASVAAAAPVAPVAMKDTIAKQLLAEAIVMTSIVLFNTQETSTTP